MSEVSRREFLTKGGAIGTTVGATALGPGETSPVHAARSSVSTEDDSPEYQSFEQPGSPPRSAYHSLAKTERKYRHLFQQSGGQTRPTPNFSRTVHAVDDLGADPSGQQSAVSALESGAEDGTLIVLPSDGKFLLDDDVNFNASGTFGMVGEGYESASGPPENGPRLIAAVNTQARISTGAVTSGLFGNFILDQTRSKAGASIWLEADQFCHGRDIRLVGVQDHVGSTAIDAQNHPTVAMTGRSESATVRVTRYVGAGNNIPTMKNKGAVPHFWVGSDNQGIAEIVQCSCQGASNGIYGSRTPGDVHVIGGEYVNNEVAQVRLAGEGSWVKGATLVVDSDNYSGPRPGDFDTTISTNGFKHEMPSHIQKPGGGVLQNCEIAAKSANRLGGLIFVRGHGGALKVDNCRVTNNTSDPSLVAAQPGSSYDPASPPPHNITITHSLFQGSQSDEIVDVSGRPQSTVTNTCFKISGASESSLSGITVGEGVGFGNQCQAGLSNPDQVGSGNASALANVSVNASANGSVGAVGTQTPQPNENNWIGTIAAGVTQMIVVSIMFLSVLAALFLAVFKKLLS